MVGCDLSHRPINSACVFLPWTAGRSWATAAQVSFIITVIRGWGLPPSDSPSVLGVRPRVHTAVLMDGTLMQCHLPGLFRGQ